MTESFVLPETEESENAPCTNTPLAARGFDSLKESTGVEYARARTVPSHPTRGITLRNAPRRNPTYATVSPYRAPRTCGPARRRDGSSRQARAAPEMSRIDRNRRESTGVECVCAGASARGISLRNVPKRNPVNFRDLTHEFTLDFRDFLSNNPLDFRDLMHEFTLDFRDLH